MTELDVAAQRLAAACADVEDIRRRLRESPAGSDALLEEVLTAARNGGEISGPCDVLHGVLQALGTRGLTGSTRSGCPDVHPAGVTRDSSTEPVYLCPIARCQRYWLPEGPAPVPRCAVTDGALRRGRL
ncbi:hypothetical protein ACWCQ0_31495 [Streptomyces massasporeus]|uniref:hypothetical protein n=1 Tax=Streptomyces massasporeus TaxID=67324 RepID=UPI0033D522E6